MCRSGMAPGSAGLAESWASTFALEDVQVWGDTTNYMLNHFAYTLGYRFPYTLVIDLDTMEIRHLAVGGALGTASVVSGILSAEHPCDGRQLSSSPAVDWGAQSQGCSRSSR